MKRILLITLLILNCNLDKLLNIGIGTFLGTLSGFAKIGCALPGSATNGKEWQLLSHICNLGAGHFLTQVFIPIQGESPLSSWTLNQRLLSQIPVSTSDEHQLIHFLEKRWLAKSSGFFPSEVNWICPSFGIPVQVNPTTTNSYARDPATKMSKSYENRVEAWKQMLPHPHPYPLLLTRPHDLRDYLPTVISVSREEKIEEIVENARHHEKALIDLTALFEDVNSDREAWLSRWESYRTQFLQICTQQNVNANQIICFQRVKQEEIGGIRILPLEENGENHHQYLLEWISCFGLTANSVEIDRWPPSSVRPTTRSTPVPALGLDAFVSYLNTYHQNWKSTHSEKNLMVDATLKLLKALLESKKWDLILHCPTRSSIAQLSFFKIREEIQQLAREDAPFFTTASHVEQIHAHLCSLLEILSPYKGNDFPLIYRDLLTSIPLPLKSLTTCALHSSGMTSVAGIFKAVEKTKGSAPRVLYGENTYFECIRAAALASQAASISDASDEDWKEVDLLFAQFNPVWKRDALKTSEYKTERIGEMVRKTLRVRGEKPLTLAIDCTLDLINSPRVGQLLEEFREAIQEGTLTIICYRSGLKFDLFGMDNYCGAPIYMIHNRDPKWSFFDSMLTDPVLQTDRLSNDWFCLAYSHVAPQLELYRTQIFDNTRTLLNKIPSKLYSSESSYRIIPIETTADPSFIDLHVYGPFHELRAAALVGGYFYLRCMGSNHPIFYRRSLGFYHLNFGLLFGEDSSTIRLTLGLDPEEVDLLADCFGTIDALEQP